ncbi:hypothetical protein FORC6_1830 [Vibrio parahaemolyticus]|nr:hypothetical protein FORC6_1830 [Vibrio parahaemolyticus]
MDGSSGASCGKHKVIESAVFAEGSARWPFHTQKRYLLLTVRDPRALAFLPTQIREPLWVI